MFVHTYLIIISKPNISKVSAIGRSSDACLLYIKQAADIRHSVTAYVCFLYSFRQISKIGQGSVNSIAFKKAQWGQTAH